jgi:hypothetical protein
MADHLLRSIVRSTRRSQPQAQHKRVYLSTMILGGDRSIGYWLTSSGLNLFFFCPLVGFCIGTQIIFV